MISSVMSSLYEMELENIKERMMVGRLVYVQKGAVWEDQLTLMNSKRIF